MGRLNETGTGRAIEMPPVCILAGGLGRRMGGLVAETPKPLLEVAGEPFLMHQLRLLAAHGTREAVLCVGYRGDQIESRIGRRQFGIAIRYSFDAPGLDGTLGAIRRALPQLGERFLVLYGDAYLRIDYAAVAQGWRESERLLDGRAPQRGSLGCLQRVLRERSTCWCTTRLGRHPRWPGSTMASGA